MDKLIMTGTQKTPTIEFDPDNGMLIIKGNSIPENPHKLFQPIYAWLEEYSKNPKEETELHVSLKYYNTSTSKNLLSIFLALEHIYKAGHTVKICWYHGPDDLDVMEAGEEYESLVSVPFQIMASKK